MALSPPGSPAVILNRPKNVPEDGAANHVYRLFWNIPDGPQRFKPPSQGADQALPRVLPGSPLPPSGYIRGPSEAGELVPLPAWTVHPPSLLYQPKDSTGESALLEDALALGTLPNIFTPYPCTGNYSPPSPSAALFKRDPSPTLQLVVLLGHLKDLVAGVCDKTPKREPHLSLCLSTLE